MRHDATPALLDPDLLYRQISHATSHEQGSNSRVALVVIDIHTLDHMTDALGYTAADTVTDAVSSRLTARCRDRDLVARLSDRRFAVLLEDISDATTARTIARRLTAAVQRPVQVRGNLVRVGVHAGIAVHEPDWSPRQLLHSAQTALRRVDGNDSAPVQEFTPDMHVHARQQWDLQVAIDRGLDAGQFVNAYQPIIDLTTGQTVAVEALARWAAPEATRMPAEFIPLAEHTGQIVRIGRAVLQQACSDAAAWAQDVPTVRTVHVNVSIRQLQEPGFVDDVARQLDAHRLHPSHITLEITESMLVAAGSTAMTTLGDLSQLGVPVVLDDFGTGYSSLAYLDQLDIDMIKIDRTFISGDVRKRRIVEAIVALGRALDLGIVAEGIEHPADATWVRKMGCTHAQGYLFGRPSPAGAIADLAGDRMAAASAGPS